MREGGRRLARVLEELREAVRPGVSTGDLDRLADRLIQEGGDSASFKGYKPRGASRPFPYALCASVNEEVVHGIPSETKILREGDIIGLDLGVTHEGLITDAAITVIVGHTDAKTTKLVRRTEEALQAGIESARAGNHIGDIGASIEEFARPLGYGVVRELAGHGVGYSVHEEPFVPNYGHRGKGEELMVGMVLALEPMFTLGKHQVNALADGYTIVTKDGSRSAHFEHTIAITEDGPRVLTALD